MKNILFILLAIFTLNSTAFAAFDLIVKPSQEEEAPIKKETKKPKLSDKKMLIMISSGVLEKAGMGLTLGLSASKQGIAVTYVIGAKALQYARKEGKQHTFFAKAMTPREILQKAIANGATVDICYMCAQALGLDAKDFIKGAKIVHSKAIFETMYQKGCKVLSF